MNNAKKKATRVRVKWLCPKCGAKPNEHGKGGYEACSNTGGSVGSTSGCGGFVCECDEPTSAEHGERYDDACPQASCYHCGWGGTFPTKPKGLESWERKALDAGWTPPAKRAREIMLSSKRS